MSKERILHMATQEFAKYGYEGLSMNKLAKKLSLNKATIYYHFEDKLSLYNAVLESILTNSQEELNQLATSKEDAKTRLKQYIEFLTCKIIEDPNIISITYREMASYGVNTDEKIFTFLNEDIESFKKIIEDLNLKKKYQDVDIQSYKFLIISTVMSYFVIQSTPHSLKHLNTFKDNAQMSKYLSEFISNILIDSICKGENNA